MAVLVNAAGEYLSATLGSPPIDSQYKLLACWVYRPAAEAMGSQNVILSLKDDTTGEYMEIRHDSTPNSFFYAKYQGSAQFVQRDSTPAADTWVLLGLVVDPAGDPEGTYVHSYVGSTRVRSAAGLGAETPDSTPYANLFIGARQGATSSRFRGYIAEVSIWTPSDLTVADGIMSELTTKVASSVTSATPIWYRPLLADQNGGSGSGALTVNGTTTFDSGVHPAFGPTAPTIGTTTSITTTGATINWTDNSADETGFKVETSPSPYSAWTAASGSPAAANATSLAVTGLSSGTTYKARVAATNGTGDSAWQETATFTTLSLTKKLKLLAHADAQGDSGVAGAVWSAPAGSNITGQTKYGEFTGATFEAALEGGKAVLKVPVADFGGSELTTSDTPVALVRNATNTTGIISGTVIEE